MIWLTITLFVVSSTVTALLLPRAPGHVAWYDKLNWRVLFDLRMWLTFFSLWDVRIALGFAYWVAIW